MIRKCVWQAIWRFLSDFLLCVALLRCPGPRLWWPHAATATQTKTRPQGAHDWSDKWLCMHGLPRMRTHFLSNLCSRIRAMSKQAIGTSCCVSLSNSCSTLWAQWQRRAVLGIKPRTSRTLSENHTTRPNSQSRVAPAISHTCLHTAFALLVLTCCLACRFCKSPANTKRANGQATHAHSSASQSETLKLAREQAKARLRGS